MQDRLKEIRDRLETSSPIPWKYRVRKDRVQEIGYGTFQGEWCGVRIAEVYSNNDTQFIVNAPSDIKFLLEAIQEAKSIIITAREELTQNCIFYKYGTEYRNCSHAHCNCQMYRTCKAIQGGKYGQTGNN